MVYSMLEVGMSTVQEIEQALTELTPEELARFRQWFEEYDAKLWDDQFESDVKSGKLDRIAGQAISDFRAGKSKEL
jgi:ABC-type Zn uptake system ZnuABC Zn-binding protein ZnuA